MSVGGVQIQGGFSGDSRIASVTPTIYPQEITRWRVTERFIRDHIPLSSRVLDIGYSPRYWPPGRYDVVSLGVKRGSTYLCDIQSEDAPSIVEERFDYICMFEVIEHLTSPARALKSIYRLAKPAALFLGSTPNRADPYYILLHRKHRDHRGVFSRQDLRSLFQQAGFATVKIKPKVMPLKLPFGATLARDVNRIVPFLGRHLFWICRRLGGQPWRGV